MGFGIPLDTWLRGPLKDWAENLLDENIRKKGGSFYTPRSIVNFMCEDVLINHLYNKSKDKLSFLQISNFIKNKKFDISHY